MRMKAEMKRDSKYIIINKLTIYKSIMTFIVSFRSWWYIYYFGSQESGNVFFLVQLLRSIQ